MDINKMTKVVMDYAELNRHMHKVILDMANVVVQIFCEQHKVSFDSGQIKRVDAITQIDYEWDVLRNIFEHWGKALAEDEFYILYSISSYVPKPIKEALDEQVK